MRISIIVPVYNVEQYLDECVQSIVNQTYQDLEILLIDDGSTDSSGAICDKWAAADSRIRVTHQKNGGISAARNAGLDMATGEAVYWVDSDDYIDKDLCRKAMEAMVSQNADMVVFGSYRFGMDKNFEAKGKVYEGYLPRERVLQEMLRGKLSDCVWSRICRRDLYDDIRFPEGRIFEDVATMHKLYLKTEKIFFLPERLYYYRKREGSVVTDLTDTALRDRFLARYQRYSAVKERYPEIAKEGIALIATVGLQYYHRSLWHPVDEDVLAMIMAFYREHRKEIRKTTENKYVKAYSTCPALYTAWRRTKNALIRLKKSAKKQK